MKKLFAILTLVIALMISIMGCKKKEITEYNYIYTGGNDLWSIEYVLDATSTYITYKERTSYESQVENKLTVTYLGDLKDLEKVKHIEITYDRGTGGGSLKQDYTDENGIQSNTFTLNSSSKNGMIPKKDSIIKVTITIDEVVQSFELEVKE